MGYWSKHWNCFSNQISRYWTISLPEPLSKPLLFLPVISIISIEEAARIYSELASAVETGWDFSTRWLEENETDLAFVKAKEIVPVDLNSLLCLNEKILSDFFSMAGKCAY